MGLLRYPQLWISSITSIMAWHGLAEVFLHTHTSNLLIAVIKSHTLSLSLSLSLSLNCTYKYRAPSSVFNQLNYNHHSSTYVVFDGCEAPCWRSRARAMLLALKCQWTLCTCSPSPTWVPHPWLSSTYQVSLPSACSCR